MEATKNSYRHFSFETFSYFLSPEIMEKVTLKRDPKHRDRCFGLEGFIWFGLFVAAHTSLPNLQQIFDLAGSMPHTIQPISLASVSAFCQYRTAFPIKTMLYLWRYLLAHFNTKFPQTNHLWHGFKLRALDGTLLNLPEKLYPHFGAAGGLGPGPVQGFLVVLYDLIGCVPVALRMAPAVNEGRPHLILKHLLAHLKSGELLLMDCGFYSLEVFCLLLKQDIHFLIPMRPKGKPKLIKGFTPNDGLYQIKASKCWKNNPCVEKFLTVRIINYQIPGFRPRRLVTSLLDPAVYPAEEIIQLYHQRWQIEIFFREFKHTLQITHWHAHTSPALWSELLFQILLVLVTRLAMAEAVTQDGITSQRLSFGKCLAEVKRALVIMQFVPIAEWTKIYQALLERLKHRIIDVRPGRRFERDTHKRRLQSRSRYHQETQLKEKENVA